MKKGWHIYAASGIITKRQSGYLQRMKRSGAQKDQPALQAEDGRKMMRDADGHEVVKSKIKQA